MLVLEARNVNYALPQGVTFIHQLGVREPSRNGDVLRVPMPVTTVYEQPMERVLHHPWRDANPFFHLIESLWMIAGRDDLKSLTRYVSTFGQFSDDGETVPGAYGKRWRDWGTNLNRGPDEQWSDQLNWVVHRLRDNPRDRRTVISMWDPAIDPDRADNGGKDVPCNLTILPFEVDGALNLTVFCRSNDMVLGAYGANAVHFSFLLEYLAGRVGMKVGRYWQVSNNFHAYVENAGDPAACWPTEWGPTDPYASGLVRPFPLFEGFEYVPAGLDLMRAMDDRERERILSEDLHVFFNEGEFAASQMVRWPFLSRVAIPMASAHRHWKNGRTADRYTGALEILRQMPAGNDWRLAAEEWIKRRHQKYLHAADAGAQS